MDTTRVTYIPAKPGIELSETVLFYMISLVPKGKLTRTVDIETYLARRLNTNWVSFHRDFVFNNDFINEYLNKGTIYFDVPLHRNISDRGLVDKRYEDDLKQEGFTLVESKVSSYSLKVQNYKKYLFNFDDFDIDMNVVMKVNQYGLSILSKI